LSKLFEGKPFDIFGQFNPIKSAIAFHAKLMAHGVRCQTLSSSIILVFHEIVHLGGKLAKVLGQNLQGFQNLEGL